MPFLISSEKPSVHQILVRKNSDMNKYLAGDTIKHKNTNIIYFDSIFNGCKYNIFCAINRKQSKKLVRSLRFYIFLINFQSYFISTNLDINVNAGNLSRIQLMCTKHITDLQYVSLTEFKPNRIHTSNGDVHFPIWCGR